MLLDFYNLYTDPFYIWYVLLLASQRQKLFWKLISPLDKAATQLTAVVHGIIGGVPIPFNPPNTNGCKDSGIKCPVAAGTTYDYTNTIPVLSAYPKVCAFITYWKKVILSFIKFNNTDKV